MLKGNIKYLLIIGGLFVLLISIHHYSEKPQNWTETFENYSKTPYACSILNEMIPDLFPAQAIRYNNACFYESFKTDSSQQNIVVIGTNFKPDQYDTAELLQKVAQGSNVFIAATHFSQLFMDSLNFNIDYEIVDSSVFKTKNDFLQLLNPKLRKSGAYIFNRKMPTASISDFDSLTIFVLGNNRNDEPNFIQIQRGEGYLFINTNPLAFTNYHLLYSDSEYASNALSYLPVQSTLIDNYYKPYAVINTSPTRYILSQVSLKYAYYVLLLSLLLYLLLETKRQQRIIPLIKPPQNRSLHFVHVIGNLYFKQRNNIDLARKKASYFKDYLRVHYYITNVSPRQKEIKIAAEKTGVDEKLIKQIFEIMEFHRTAKHLSDDGLIALNNKIEQFYLQCS